MTTSRYILYKTQYCITRIFRVEESFAIFAKFLILREIFLPRNKYPLRMEFREIFLPRILSSRENKILIAGQAPKMQHK